MSVCRYGLLSQLGRYSLRRKMIVLPPGGLCFKMFVGQAFWDIPTNNLKHKPPGSRTIILGRREYV